MNNIAKKYTRNAISRGFFDESNAEGINKIIIAHPSEPKHSGRWSSLYDDINHYSKRQGLASGSISPTEILSKFEDKSLYDWAETVDDEEIENLLDVPEEVKMNIYDYFHENDNLSDYEPCLIIRSSNNPKDDYLYSVGAHNDKHNSYTFWETYNASTDSLNNGHYGLTCKELLKLAAEDVNDIQYNKKVNSNNDLNNRDWVKFFEDNGGWDFYGEFERAYRTNLINENLSINLGKENLNDLYESIHGSWIKYGDKDIDQYIYRLTELINDGRKTIDSIINGCPDRLAEFVENYDIRDGRHELTDEELDFGNKYQANYEDEEEEEME